MIWQNRMFVDFPIHFYAYQKINEGYELFFHNYSCQLVEEIKLRIGSRSFVLPLHSKDEKIHVIIKDDDDISLAQHFITIEEVNISKKIYETKDYELKIIQAPTSIYTLRPHHKLYQYHMAKQTNKERSHIQYLAQEGDIYWDCPCGFHNPKTTKTCLVCGISQESAFSSQEEFNQQKMVSNHLFKNLKIAITYFTLFYVFQLTYEALIGEFLFDNLSKNLFFGVLNRIILPLVFIASLFGLWRTRLKMEIKKMSIFAFLIVILFLYFNLLGVFYFIGSSYNHIFLIGLNLFMLWLMVYALLTKWKDKFIYIGTAIALCAMVVFGIKYQSYTIYELQIVDHGLHLTVSQDQESYRVPDRIEGMPVVEVTFSGAHDYQIEHLTIGRYIRKINFSTAIVLDDLKTVSVDENNPYFYVENNMIYNQDNTLRLVPIYTETLYINDEIIESGPFRDLIYLKNLTIGSNVKEIKHDAFINAFQLTSLVFEEESTLELIGDDAFANATSLTSVDLPKSLQRLGIGIFRNATNLTSLRAPFIGEEREQTDDLFRSHDILVYFFGSKTYLHYNLIPESLTHVEFYDINQIHNTTFYNVSHLTSIILPSDMTEIGIRSFYGTTDLISFTIPDGVTVIPVSAFENSGISTLIIPASVTSIGDNAFKNTNLTSVTYLGDINSLVISSIGNESIITILK